MFFYVLLSLIGRDKRRETVDVDFTPKLISAAKVHIDSLDAQISAAEASNIKELTDKRLIRPQQVIGATSNEILGKLNSASFFLSVSNSSYASFSPMFATVLLAKRHITQLDAHISLEEIGCLFQMLEQNYIHPHDVINKSAKRIQAEIEVFISVFSSSGMLSTYLLVAWQTETHIFYL